MAQRINPTGAGTAWTPNGRGPDTARPPAPVPNVFACVDPFRGEGTANPGLPSFFQITDAAPGDQAGPSLGSLGRTHQRRGRPARSAGPSSRSALARAWT